MRSSLYPRGWYSYVVAGSAVVAFSGRGFLGFQAVMGRWRDGRVDDRRGCRVVRAERPFRPLAAYGGTYHRRIDLKLGVAAVIAGRKPVLQFARASVVCASEILNTRLLIARTHSTARSSGQVRPHRRTYVRRRNPSSSLLAVQSPSLFHCLVCPGGTAAQGQPAGGGRALIARYI